jgi:hypothetical protein
VNARKHGLGTPSKFAREFCIEMAHFRGLYSLETTATLALPRFVALLLLGPPPEAPLVCASSIACAKKFME